MFVRGVYTKAEEKMIAESKENMDKLVGWITETPSREIGYPVHHRVASRDLIIHMANAADYWNPLWRDDEYARNTRWGAIIAPPFFQECISHGGPNFFLDVPPEVGYVNSERIGGCWEFLHPIYENDSFKVWAGPGYIEDVTPEGGSEERRIKIMGHDVNYINQHNQVTAIYRRFHIFNILPAGTKKKTVNDVKFTEDYQYTKEDLEAIDRVADEEERRGAKILFWEDVNVGDVIKPVVHGPLTPWDTVVEMQGYGIAIMPVREVIRQTFERCLTDPVTNVIHKGIEMHFSEKTAKLAPQGYGFYSTTILAVTIQHFLARMMTNWMGDDGFIRRFDWLKLGNVAIGDTMFGRGKVKKKYITENGEYLVDLDVWVEDIRGYVTDVAEASIRLMSKEKTFTIHSQRLVADRLIGGMEY